jgi:hypothetical protein
MPAMRFELGEAAAEKRIGARSLRSHKSQGIYLSFLRRIVLRQSRERRGERIESRVKYYGIIQFGSDLIYRDCD